MVKKNFFIFLKPFHRGGPLKSNYTFHQLHFHWGEDNEKGSEHRINGKSFPMEMHIVHLNNDTDNPMFTDRGVSVLGFFFQISVRLISIYIGFKTLFRKRTTKP